MLRRAKRQTAPSEPDPSPAPSGGLLCLLSPSLKLDERQRSDLSLWKRGVISTGAAVQDSEQLKQGYGTIIMADDEFDVGSRLKTLRARAGFSQRQLAERAHVPHAQISIIEHNKSSPSVSTLRKILGGLGVSMADFVDLWWALEDCRLQRRGNAPQAPRGGLRSKARLRWGRQLPIIAR